MGCSVSSIYNYFFFFVFSSPTKCRNVIPSHPFCKLLVLLRVAARIRWTIGCVAPRTGRQSITGQGILLSPTIEHIQVCAVCMNTEQGREGIHCSTRQQTFNWFWGTKVSDSWYCFWSWMWRKPRMNEYIRVWKHSLISTRNSFVLFF